MKWYKKILFPLILIPAIVIAVMLSTNKKPLREKTDSELVKSVSALRVDKMTVVPRLLSYGEVQPAKVWKAVAEVSGKIVWKAPRLNSGEFFDKGDLLLKIDDSSAKLNVKKAKADIKKTEAKIKELERGGENLKVTLALREKMLKVKLQELDRKAKLFKAKATSKSNLEQEELNILTEKNSIQSIRSELSLLPSQIEYQKSQLESYQAQMEQAELDLKYTQITAPFACRISSVNVEVSQYAQVGTELLQADWIGRSEITAQLDVSRMGTLISRKLRKENLRLSGQHIPDSMGLSAEVKFEGFTWKARCERLISSVDVTTRTIGLVVSVENTYELARKTGKPPLVKGMFCTVEVFGSPQADSLVIPRAALHDGSTVYVVNSEKRLEFRKVKVKYELLNFTIIESGLKPGESIITSDVVPAISGMKLRPVYDSSFYSSARKEIGYMTLPEIKTTKLSLRSN